MQRMACPSYFHTDEVTNTVAIRTCHGLFCQMSYYNTLHVVQVTTSVFIIHVDDELWCNVAKVIVSIYTYVFSTP